MPLLLQRGTKLMLQLALLLLVGLVGLPLHAQTKPKPSLPDISTINTIDQADYQARFDGQTLPASIVAGESYSIPVKFTNLGNLTWTTADQFLLGAQSPQDNANWGMARVALPNSVPKNSSVTFYVNITAPITPGKYTFQWRMVREYLAWFGDFSTPVTIDVLPQRRGAKYVIQTVPASVASGATFSVPVTMTNTGNTTWKAGTNYNLGAQNSENNRTWVYAARVIVPRNVAPLENVIITINATAPSVTTTKAINFQWRMVQDPYEWFGDLTPNVAVQVNAPVIITPPTPTVPCPSNQTPPASGTYTAAIAGSAVYGSNTQGYSSDSDIPRALVHSGLLQPGQSAYVTVTNLGYLSNFIGTTANGITTLSYPGSWCTMRLSVAITPPALPTITASHSPASLVAGQSFSMSWSSTNASSISYSCSNGSGLVLSGSSQNATGTVSATALAGWVNDAPNCTWTATGGGKTATSTDRLTTTTPPPAAPVINSVSRNPVTMTAGSGFTVSWSTTNATSMAYTCTPNSGSTGYNGNGSGLAANGSTSGTAIAAWGGTSSTCVWTATGAGGATATYRETVTTNTAPGVEVVTYVHTDALGSPVARTDANGNLISRTRYEPYGATAAGAVPTIGFTGHVNDANTGLVYMQQRYYDPIAGRFLSTDPVLTDGKTGDQFNRYAYANNNPYKYIDPDGRIAETPWDAFNVALGATSMAVNLSKGNYGSAAVDAGGLILDSIATAVPVIPGGAATVIGASRVTNAAKPVVSRIKESSKLVKEAEKSGKNEKVQRGIDKLTSELKKGNLNPGKGTEGVGKGISEARHDDGARVYFRETKDSIEILGKSGKDNQPKVIDEVLSTFK